MRMRDLSDLIAKHARWLPLLFGILTLATLILTLAPADSLSNSTIWDYDKLGHAALFGTWTFFLGLILITKDTNDFILVERGALTALLVGVFFGGSIELLQYALPIQRGAEWLDFIFDVLGSGVAWIILRAIEHQTLGDE